VTTALLARQHRQPAITASTQLWLGTHQTGWLWDGSVDFPVFVSRRRLKRYKRLYRATVPAWALDSGGFTELSTYDRWTIGPREYVAEVARYQREIGGLAWAAPQDFMCEPEIIYGGVINGKRFPGTGLSVPVHQHLTVLNYVMLINIWPEYSDDPCPFIPVLQGWTMGDYRRCAALYQAAGVDLAAAPLVGLGTVCRRQSTVRTGLIAAWLADDGIRLHGFGLKAEGLALYGEHLVSCDSLAWSFDARSQPALPGCGHPNCSNCRVYASRWRARMLADPGSEVAAA
jgi:hypothetical protein